VGRRRGNKMKEIVIITLLVSVMFMYLTNKGKK